jgi:hypothetical protein
VPPRASSLPHNGERHALQALLSGLEARTLAVPDKAPQAIRNGLQRSGSSRAAQRNSNTISSTLAAKLCAVRGRSKTTKK